MSRLMICRFSTGIRFALAVLAMMLALAISAHGQDGQTPTTANGRQISTPGRADDTSSRLSGLITIAKHNESQLKDLSQSVAALTTKMDSAKPENPTAALILQALSLLAGLAAVGSVLALRKRHDSSLEDLKESLEEKLEAIDRRLLDLKATMDKAGNPNAATKQDIQTAHRGIEQDIKELKGLLSGKGDARPPNVEGQIVDRVRTAVRTELTALTDKVGAIERKFGEMKGIYEGQSRQQDSQFREEANRLRTSFESEKKLREQREAELRQAGLAQSELGKKLASREAEVNELARKVQKMREDSGASIVAPDRKSILQAIDQAKVFAGLCDDSRDSQLAVSSVANDGEVIGSALSAAENGDGEGVSRLIDPTRFDPHSYPVRDWDATVAAKRTLEAARAAALEFISRYGFTIDRPVVGVDLYEKDKHDLRESIRTSDASLAGKIAELRRPGLHYKGKVVRPARIVQFAIGFETPPVGAPPIPQEPVRQPIASPAIAPVAGGGSSPRAAVEGPRGELASTALPIEEPPESQAATLTTPEPQAGEPDSDIDETPQDPTAEGDSVRPQIKEEDLERKRRVTG